MARRSRKEDGGDALIKSAEMIGWALGGLEREIANTRERLAHLTEHAARLRARIGRTGPAAEEQEEAAPATPAVSRRQRRRSMSPEARQRLSEMMTKRWADRRKAGGS